MATYLGLDLGASELKALFLDEIHQSVAVVSIPLAVASPLPR
jgi:hypothetical protein